MHLFEIFNPIQFFVLDSETYHLKHLAKFRIGIYQRSDRKVFMNIFARRMEAKPFWQGNKVIKIFRRRKKEIVKDY
jgi:hypothetical protein